MKAYRILIAAALAVAFAQAASAQTGDEIADKYVNAIGGRAALEKLKSRHLIGKVTLSTPVGQVNGTVETFNQAPNKARTLMKLDLSALGVGEATIDQRFDGASGYVLDTLQGNREITGGQLDSLSNGFFPTPFLNYKDRGAVVEFVRKDKVADRDAYVVLLKPKTGPVVQAFIDAESYLMIKMVVVVNLPQLGGDVPQTTEFSDFRDQDGVKIPFQVKNSSPIQAYTVNVTKVENNAPLDETMFSRPQ